MFYNQLTTKADLMKTKMRPFKEICDFREVLNQSPKNTHILYMYLIDYILTYVIHIYRPTQGIFNDIQCIFT